MQERQGMDGPALVLVDTAGFTGNIPAVIKLDLPPNTPVVLGRGTPNWQANVPMTATRDGKDIISRKHAKLERVGGKLLITDLKSLNGTYVNSTRIESHALQDGDVVQFGGAAKLKYGERLVVSGGSITYRFVAGTAAPSPKKRKAAAMATPSAAASRARHDEVQDLTDKVNEQQQKIEELLDKLQQSAAESGRLQKELEAAMEASRQSRQEQEKEEEEKENTGAALHLDVNVLESSLRCAICRGVLVDPVVLPCSHGFCLACVAARARDLPPRSSLCPSCKPSSRRAKPRAAGQAQAGLGVDYFRCNHLDNILWTWSAAVPDTVRKRHAEKEAAQRRRYKELGCDEASAGEEEEESDIEPAVPDSEAGLQESADEGQRCPGCNEFGHDLEDCPHRSVSEAGDDDEDDY